MLCVLSPVKYEVYILDLIPVNIRLAPKFKLFCPQVCRSHVRGHQGATECRCELLHHPARVYHLSNLNWSHCGRAELTLSPGLQKNLRRVNVVLFVATRHTDSDSASGPGGNTGISENEC